MKKASKKTKSPKQDKAVKLFKQLIKLPWADQEMFVMTWLAGNEETIEITAKRARAFAKNEGRSIVPGDIE